MMAFLLAGGLLGLSAGLSPGPLLALVASETLRHGIRAGSWIALAPLLTDLPIILGTLLVLRPLAGQNLPLALVNLGGGLYLVWLGIEGIRFRGAELAPVGRSGSLRRGVIANFLNPNPYLFWFAVGAPTVLDAWDHGWLAVAAFIIAFYTFLVGSKVLLALGLGYAGSILRSGAYIVLMRGLGALLLLYGLLFLYQCWRLLDTTAS